MRQTEVLQEIRKMRFAKAYGETGKEVDYPRKWRQGYLG